MKSIALEAGGSTWRRLKINIVTPKATTGSRKSLRAIYDVIQ
jgi:hypothetical protein